MERKRHFFKVLIPGFHQRLNLPPAVSKELETQKSRRATLQSCKGTWEITMSKNYENNLLCFDEGRWSEFVESHALHVGDFLVFEHTKDLRFNVLVFDPTACEKNFHVEPNETTKKKDGDSEEALNSTKKRMRGGGDGRPYFVKKMSPSFATKDAKVNIPVGFMKSNGLGQNYSSVSLRDPNNGREWSVNLSKETFGGIRNRMWGRGWHNFYVANKLKIGDTCAFELRRRLLTSTTIFFDVYINVCAPI